MYQEKDALPPVILESGCAQDEKGAQKGKLLRGSLGCLRPLWQGSERAALSDALRRREGGLL
jgi:hypothetical protein